MILLSDWFRKTKTENTNKISSQVYYCFRKSKTENTNEISSRVYRNQFSGLSQSVFGFIAISSRVYRNQFSGLSQSVLRCIIGSELVLAIISQMYYWFGKTK